MSVTIVNGEAIDAGGAPLGEATLRKGSRTAKRVPNDLIRQARLALRSQSGSGRPMSRQELAEAVNAWAYEHTGRRCSLDASYIGTLKRAETPWAHHRAGLRAVLGAATDAELGLWIVYSPRRADRYDRRQRRDRTDAGPGPGLVRIKPDLAMGDELPKKTRTGNLLTVSESPTSPRRRPPMTGSWRS